MKFRLRGNLEGERPSKEFDWPERMRGECGRIHRAMTVARRGEGGLVARGKNNGKVRAFMVSLWAATGLGEADEQVWAGDQTAG